MIKSVEVKKLEKGFYPSSSFKKTPKEGVFEHNRSRRREDLRSQKFNNRKGEERVSVVKGIGGRPTKITTRKQRIGGKIIRHYE